MAFGFGLVHGLGLSNVLRDLGLSGRELLPALLGFNVGVEIGQLAIVAPMFLLVLRLRKRETVFARSRNRAVRRSSRGRHDLVRRARPRRALCLVTRHATCATFTS